MPIRRSRSAGAAATSRAPRSLTMVRAASRPAPGRLPVGREVASTLVMDASGRWWWTWSLPFLIRRACASCRHRRVERCRQEGHAPRAAGPSPCGRGLMSAAVLGRCAWLQRGASLANAYLDALGPYFGCLWHHDLQHAVLCRGLDLVGLHVAGQGDRAAEGAVEPLGAVHLLLGGVGREVPPALTGQQAVLEGGLPIV